MVGVERPIAPSNAQRRMTGRYMGSGSGTGVDVAVGVGVLVGVGEAVAVGVGVSVGTLEPWHRATSSRLKLTA